MRQAFRAVRRSPRFSAVAVLILTVAIGANGAVFSFAERLLLASPALGAPDTLVGIYAKRNVVGCQDCLTYSDLEQLRDPLSGLVDITGWRDGWVWLKNGDRSQEFVAGFVTGDFADIVGIQAQIGRFIVTGDERQPVVVLSDHVWRQQFDARADVVGRAIQLQREWFTVVGVAPAGLRGLYPERPIGFWLPMFAFTREHATHRQDPTLHLLVGRLRPGVSGETVTAALTAPVAALVRHRTPSGPPVSVVVAPFRGVHPMDREEVRRTSLMLAVGGALLLMISCANLAGLLLGRGLDREREIAIRLSIGASRGCIVRQLIAEHAVLALLGGLGGWLLAEWLHELLLLNTFYDTRLEQSGINLSMLAVAMLVSLISVVVFGVVPATHASRTDLMATLRLAGSAIWSEHPWLRGVLIVAQVALCVSLLGASGMLLTSLYNVVEGSGRNLSSIAQFRMRPSRIGVTPQEGRQYNRRLVAELGAIPGVASVSLASVGNTVGWRRRASVHRPGAPPIHIDINNDVTPGYFEMLDIPVLRGRPFRDSDAASAPRVVVLNGTLSQHLWGDHDPLGETLVVDGQAHTVIGIVQDTYVRRGSRGTEPAFYRCFWQTSALDSRLLVRVQGSAEPVIERLRRRIVAINPDVHVGQEMTLREHAHATFHQERTMSRVLGFSAGSALVLTATGLFAMLAYSVARRRREIGIRIALGALPRQVQVAVLARGCRLAALGTLVGVAGALTVGRLLQHFLYGIDPLSPGILAATMGVPLGVALLASYLPARAAARVDPLQVLRLE